MTVIGDAGSALDVEGLRSRVRDALTGFLDRQREGLAAVAPECVVMADAVADLVSSGKRLRPAFCYWAWRGAGGRDDDAAVRAATALELFQAAALIHDDLMDGSDTRRGMPAVHQRFAGHHASARWRGAAERFGLAGAVLTGDVCLAWSEELFSNCGLPDEALRRARPAFDQMRTELMAGQYLDVLEQARPADPAAAVERARRVIRFKSARYSVEHPLLIGGLLAGAPVALLRAYGDLGAPIGEAFQLRDDILGVFGDPGQTGKPTGDDLREGKRTVLVALAMQRGDEAQRARLERGLGDPELGEDGVAELRAVIVGTGALAEVERRVDELAATAHAALAGAEVAPPADRVLAALLTAAVSRAH